VRFRTVAAGVALAALAGTTVPLAMSGSASAKVSAQAGVAKATTTTVAGVTLTGCSPATATIGKTLTIHGTDLTGATAVKIGKKNATAAMTGDKATTITINPIPNGIKPVTPNAATVSVTTPAGKASVKCTFQKAKKKSKK
jgi:hypothetical protein